MKRNKAAKRYDIFGDSSKGPLHSEFAFRRGLHFRAKYEFKAKGTKKRKVTIAISIDGVKVSLPQKKKNIEKQKLLLEDDKLVISQHPIHRIFYVSHDSQDRKIFSYIARDESTTGFNCSVFKAYKKNQAMQIVRTIGEAFDVCHKIGVQAVEEQNDVKMEGTESQESSEEVGRRGSSSPRLFTPAIAAADLSNVTGDRAILHHSHVSQNPLMTEEIDCFDDDIRPMNSMAHQLQLLIQQLELERRQTQFACAHVRLLKDQLSAETTARIDAQMRTEELLMQNRGLIDHISVLVNHLIDLENKPNIVRTEHVMSNHALSQQQDGLLDLNEDAHTKNNGWCDSVVPSSSRPTSDIPCGSVKHLFIDSYAQESPDSGNPNMSPDSLSLSIMGQSESWHTPSAQLATTTTFHDDVFLKSTGSDPANVRLSFTLPCVSLSSDRTSTCLPSRTQEAIEEFENLRLNSRKASSQTSPLRDVTNLDLSQYNMLRTDTSNMSSVNDSNSSSRSLLESLTKQSAVSSSAGLLSDNEQLNSRESDLECSENLNGLLVLEQKRPSSSQGFLPRDRIVSSGFMQDEASENNANLDLTGLNDFKMQRSDSMTVEAGSNDILLQIGGSEQATDNVFPILQVGTGKRQKGCLLSESLVSSSFSNCL